MKNIIGVESFFVGLMSGFVLSIFVLAAVNKIGNLDILKEIVKFSLLAIILFMISYFIYPTPYHYSMYRGQYPMMINWLNGETKIFNGSEWTIIENKIEEK